MARNEKIHKLQQKVRKKGHAFDLVIDVVKKSDREYHSLRLYESLRDFLYEAADDIEALKETSDTTHVDFESVLDDMYETYKRKNHDYGNSFADLYEEYGATYPVIHIKEKFKRIETLLKNDAQVNDESLDDSILDAANYLIMWYVERANK